MLLLLVLGLTFSVNAHAGIAGWAPGTGGIECMPAHEVDGAFEQVERVLGLWTPPQATTWHRRLYISGETGPRAREQRAGRFRFQH